jgi:large subunit ribosomal protein L1
MRSKLYRSRLAALVPNKHYALEDAVKCLKGMPKAKFDESVEVAFRLGIDAKQSDQAIRGAIVLPQGTGKTVRVVVAAEGNAAQVARDAGADFVGYEDLVKKIQEGWMDFDVMIATPAAMKLIRTLGRQLGPRGLMPNPKTGTVTDDVASAVREAKAGRVEYRSDKAGVVHVLAGKLSFSEAALLENLHAAVEAIRRARPSAAKGVYMQSVTICATMSPGVRVDVRSLAKAL